MEWLSHVLLTNLVFKELPMKERWWAIFFGIAPDIFSFFGIWRMEFLKKMMFFKKIPSAFVPRWVITAYNVSHSLPLWLIIFLALWFMGHHLWAIVFCGWAFHIFLDFFTHNPQSVTQTKVFWPLSSWHFHSWSWSNKKFLIIEYAIISLLYWMFYF